MLNEIVLSALKAQSRLERTNAATYDMLASACDLAYWPNSSAWMKRAANEEREHADKIITYIIDRDGIPEYRDIVSIPVIDASSLTPAFEAALMAEQSTTEAIKTLYYVAEESEDPQTCVFLHWFIDEQTKSEATLRNLLTQLRKLDMNGKMIFDKEIEYQA